MVALAAELFTPEVLQVLRPVQVVEVVPLTHGGTGGEKLLELFQLVLGDGIKRDGHAPAAAEVGNLPVVLQAAASQRQSEGGAQAGVIHLEVEGAVVDRPLSLIDVPPYKDGAGGGVANAAAAVTKKLAQLGKVLQPEGMEIQHTFKSLSFLYHYIR